MKHLIAIVFVFLFFNVSNAQAQENPYLKGWEDSIVTEDTVLDFYICVHAVYYFSYHLLGRYDNEIVMEICHEHAQSFFKYLYEDDEINEKTTQRKERVFFKALEYILKKVKPSIENDFILNY